MAGKGDETFRYTFFVVMIALIFQHAVIRFPIRTCTNS